MGTILSNGPSGTVNHVRVGPGGSWVTLARPSSPWLLVFILAVCTIGCASNRHSTGIVPSAHSQYPLREWSKLSSERKVRVMAGAMELARKDGTELKLPPTYYVREIDRVCENYDSNRDIFGMDLGVGLTFRTIAVMEGDWGNGEGKVEQAKRYFGPDTFELFKSRYPDKYRHLIELDEAANAAKPSQ